MINNSCFFTLRGSGTLEKLRSALSHFTALLALLESGSERVPAWVWRLVDPSPLNARRLPSWLCSPHALHDAAPPILYHQIAIPQERHPEYTMSLIFTLPGEWGAFPGTRGLALQRTQCCSSEEQARAAGSVPQLGLHCQQRALTWMLLPGPFWKKNNCWKYLLFCFLPAEGQPSFPSH